MNPTEFLMRVWSIQCEPGEFVCLSSRVPWRDTLLPFNDELPEKIDRWLKKNEGKDCYFCPLPFSEPRRSKKAVARSRMLWSDIDDGDYKRAEPSVLWETSPGRFSGLWMLDDYVYPEEAARLSRQVAYYIGADRGGWDLTQVLRIPGTRNYKYLKKPRVELRYFTDTVREIPEGPLAKWASTIPRKLIRIIEGRAQVGKRSDMLWYLEHELCDLGIPLRDVIAILRDSDWNKYRGRADEDERFDAEMEKIREARTDREAPTRIDSVVLEVVDYSQLMASSASSPGWMIRDFWMRKSHGIIAGEPKSFKSTLALDMFFSVASDKPFLGRFPVEYGGPALIVQNENADWIMRDRLEKLAFSRGEVGNVRTGTGRRLRLEWARNLPLFFVNQQGFTLDDAANKAALEELIDRVRPAVVNLDPLYLMFSGDVNSAQDLFPVLQWCLYIKQTYDCAVVLVHHYNKAGESKRGGQRMLGSTTLHGWIESAWYIQAGENSVKLNREFRGAGMYPAVELRFSMGGFGEPQYGVELRDGFDDQVKSDSDTETVLDILATSSLTLNELKKRAGLSRRRIESILAQLSREGLVKKYGGNYAAR